MDEIKIDKRTKEYRDSIPDKPDFEKCSECGCDLPPLPEGGRRIQPEACRDCIWKDY
jgi:hypothetical protein